MSKNCLYKCKGNSKINNWILNNAKISNPEFIGREKNKSFLYSLS